MELSTVTTITHLPSITSRHVYLSGNDVRSRISPPLQGNTASIRLQSRTLRCARKFPGETVSEETSKGVSDFGLEKPEVVADKVDNFTTSEVVAADKEKDFSSESQAEDEQTLAALEFLNDIKLDSDNTYSIVLYGFGAVLAIYLTSAIVGSLESVPLLPKLMEVVGLGYTLWFTTRYLLFKSNREELKTKISEIKKQVLGSDSD
ncbi:Protein CURVATURE THYLAKOID 1D [Hirschfeldia incana]|nr:Protein CURVATURE THYLAKOID 1D [Hirschfeldia incana]